MPSRSPLTPIFDPKIRRGQVSHGAMIGTTTIQATAPASVVTATTTVGAGTFWPIPLPPPVAWWDASDASTVHSSPVTSWDDKSGNGRTLTATGSPGTGGTTQNGLNVITLNGSSGGFFRTNFLFNLADVSIFMVAKAASGSNQAYWSEANTATDTHRFTVNNRASDDALQAFWRNASGDQLNGLTAAGSGGAVMLITATDTAANVSGHYITRVDRANDHDEGYARGATFTHNTFSIGYIRRLTPAFFLNGYICEMIVYDTVLSTGNRNDVEGYLKAKWGTP